MVKVVADTSALLSIATVTEVLDAVFEEYEMFVPQEVVNELEEAASYDDETARASRRVLSSLDEDAVMEVERDTDFPLDEGENAAVSLADERDADLFFCDEFNRIGLVHASLPDARLVTTPKLLEVLIHKGTMSEEDAVEALDRMTEARSWEGNSYVDRARESLVGAGDEEEDSP